MNREGDRDRTWTSWFRSTVVLVALLAPMLPADAAGQYFGRNKVQYDDFDFRVLETEHFRIYYYPEEGEAIEDVARMSERWYERLARTFQHEFEQQKPLIIYADHPDFQQTNTLQGMIGEGVGGVTESLKNRVIMPLTGSYADTDHVLGHELVHAFQYNIAQGRRGGGLQGLTRLPLWLVEGMAEYLSVGRDDPLTAMWLRDAIHRDDFPTIDEMTREARFFPYRFGQALWAYVGGSYGDDAVTRLFRQALRVGFQPALGRTLGLSSDTLSAQWRRRVERQYVPLMTGRTSPEDVGRLIIGPERHGGEQNIAPSLSPDGRYVAFLSEKDLFSIDLYLADARTGEVIRQLASANSDPHVDALSYIESSGTWSPDGQFFAYVIFADGDNQIRIIQTEDGDEWRTIETPGIGAINNPAWSPNGRYIAFTGMVGGISDLFMWDVQDGTLTQLTDDKYGDFHPTWSPDGSTLAFTSDRGPETDFEQLTYSEQQLALIDVATRQVRVLDVFGNARHSNPQYSPDGRRLYFLSDQDGFSDVYSVGLEAGDVRRLTRVVTGVSGITAMSPALSVAAEQGGLAFSIFSDFGFRIHTLPAGSRGEPVGQRVADVDLRGRHLPPATPDRPSRVAAYLDNPSIGLPPADRYTTGSSVAYTSRLQLDYIGQPSIGVGTDRFGQYAGGGASASFSDMLGDRHLGVAFQAQGTVKDIGGQVQYADLSDRWNWGVAAGRIPYMLIFTSIGRDENGDRFIAYNRQRIFLTSASGQVAYPLSTTRRFEFGGGAIRYAYDLEQDRYFIDEFGRIIRAERREIDQECIEDEQPFNRFQLCEPDPLNLAQMSAAYVGDNSFFGLTSPIRGERFRYELQQTVGTENFLTALADWRRYFQPDQNLTLAFRGMHYGRYGGIDNANVIQPLFLGFETFIRGYSYESFETRECNVPLPDDVEQTACPTFDRLFGNRLALANAEMRVPLIGVERYGIINFPYLPTELVAFADGGLAWSAGDNIELELSRSSVRRVPVFSTGVGARFNILGFLILEAYWAYPWQRPLKSGHWGFQIAPGW